MVNVIVLSLALFIVIIAVMILVFFIKPEAFGLLISIFMTMGIITVLFSYVKPEIEKMNDPNATMAFWIGSVIFIIAMFLLVSFMIRHTKTLKKSNRQLRDENKMLKKRKE